ncbi:homeobox protein 5 [Striga asiatica]|uniref:Homeobox protein 5 n=1 Tax=Striga asiatica TaxID=4170 RepID=A0A5A7PPD5_STRAF|nr:homeobox protein 5 [Striga asiatica]
MKARAAAETCGHVVPKPAAQGWIIKQLEKGYSLLKANHDALKHNWPKTAYFILSCLFCAANYKLESQLNSDDEGKICIKQEPLASTDAEMEGSPEEIHLSSLAKKCDHEAENFEMNEKEIKIGYPSAFCNKPKDG